MARTLFLLLSLVSAAWANAAQETVPLRNTDVAADRTLRREFEAALTADPDAARGYLSRTAGRPWLAELNFRDVCALSRAIEGAPYDDTLRDQDAALAEALVLTLGLHNPSLALRESAEYLPLVGGTAMFEQFARVAPDEALALAAGASRSARLLREQLAQSKSPDVALLALLATEDGVDLPRRSRMAIFAGRMARGELSFDAALKLAGSMQQFFAAVVDMRAAATTAAESAPLDRVLESESLMLCRAAQEGLQRTFATDLAHFRTRDLYALLAFGRAEATPAIFSAVFDRLLLPKWKAEAPKAASLLALLDRTHNWELRDFAAGAVAAHRFDALLSLAGRDLIGRLAGGIDRTSDPLKEGMRLAEIVDATSSPELLAQLASIVSEEFQRCQKAGDLRGETIYGLLAARLSVHPTDEPYLPFFRSSASLDTALLFGKENDCVQRHFFYDDDDGVKSFESFRATYQRDPDWEIEEPGPYVHFTGKGPDGRRIEIFANVPIDGHLPKNAALAGEAQRRQQTITAVLESRGLVPAVIVHRGHSFWVERTLSYVAATARLVILGSCGGATEVHSVIESSHEAQVIATRGIGETAINDSILKAVNDRILKGERTLEWSVFWKELSGSWGRNALFREYIAPHQDAATVFLRAYYRYLDSL